MIGTNVGTNTPMAGLFAALHNCLSGTASGTASGGGPAAPREAEPRPVMPRDRAHFTFSNGDFIYHGDSLQPIEPQSAEGRTIEGILARQRADREANARQRAIFWAITQSAIPRAVVEGKAPMSAIKLGPGITVDDLFRQHTAR